MVAGDITGADTRDQGIEEFPGERAKLKAQPSSPDKFVPVQTVDATPFNALIRQSFSGRGDLFGRPRSKPSQGRVLADLTKASDLAFVFNAKRVRLECCVDPLKPLIRSRGTQMRAFRNPAVEQPANEVIPRANQHGHQEHEA
jgi:hypothetical protein